MSLDSLPYRSEFDVEAMACLVPLKEAGARLFFPFFANTFPLAFHFRSLLAGAENDDQVKNSIALVPWGDEDRILERFQDGRQPLIFYSTTRKYRVLENRFEGLHKVELWTYQPRWIFSEFNLPLFDEWQKGRQCSNHGEVSFDYLTSWLSNKVDRIEIFTEIWELANAIKETRPEELRKRCFLVHAGDSSFFSEDHLKTNTVRFFVYGAPISSYFKRKAARYLPFEVGECKSPDIEELRVVVVFRCADGEASKVEETLLDYHQMLDTRARSEPADGVQQFRALQYHYNRLARILQHRSAFDSSKDFASCIAEYQKLITEAKAIGGHANS